MYIIYEYFTKFFSIDFIDVEDRIVSNKICKHILCMRYIEEDGISHY